MLIDYLESWYVVSTQCSVLDIFLEMFIIKLNVLL